MVRAEDNQIIGPSELADTVESGIKLEMGILMRQGTAFRDTKDKCPRCGHMNQNATIDHDWIEWRVPPNIYPR